MVRSLLHGRAISLAAACLIFALSSPAAAQYFGRQKVRYRTFDFQVLKTEHFDIYYYSSEREGVDIAARMAERWYSRLQRVFSHHLSSRQPLILYGSHTDFEQTNVIPDLIDEGTGGVTESVQRRIVLPLAGPLSDSDHVIGHELVHAFQFDIADEVAGSTGTSHFQALPLWFTEGMAEYLSLGNVDANTAMKLRDALKRDRLPSIHDLDGPKYFPYQWGHAALAYMAGRYSDAVVARLLKRAIVLGNAEMAIKAILGISTKDLSNDWHTAIRETYAPAMAASVPPIIGNRLVVQAKGFGEDLNIGPALSPDGRWVAFLSSRGLFSTDLYVADATTGHIVRKLTNTAGSQHFSSIEFIRSTGTWDPAGERIALGVIVGGRPALALINARTGRHNRDIVIKGIDEILNPAWSPDGHAIAFAAMRQGLTDLYVYDLDTATLSQLTNDAYTDLQPAWAPDSRRIVFSSDRFSSDLDSLRFGSLRLAVTDTTSGVIEPMPALDGGKHLNAQWAPDGSAVYFIGDPDGVANVYRVSIATSRVEQLTAVDTGVSGILASSPALAVASGTGRLAVTVFNGDKFDIYVREPSQPAGPVTPLPVNAAALPPATNTVGVLTALMSDAQEGLPAEQTYPTSPYSAKLSLAGIAQPTAGVGVGQFGATASGGTALMFTDTLGDHVLATAVQVNSAVAGMFNVKDIAFQSEYLNMVRRWNWGVSGSQLPYVTGAIDSSVTLSPTGDVVPVDRQIIYRQTERRASGILSYPFDRVRRVELRGGISQTSFDKTVVGLISSQLGTVLSKTHEASQLAPSLNLATTAAALVFDDAIYGPTSPLQGTRYRLEVSPAFGSINYSSVLVDYRPYRMLAPFYTVAARVIHYGRYGRGGDDARLYPVYVNDPSFVRGYDTLEYHRDCATTLTDPCQTNGFSGSRMFVGNLELRFPLLRPFGVSPFMYGPFPTEVVVFADSGVAWTGADRPRFLGGSRQGVASAGVAFRVRLGAIASEFDITRPFQRPGSGWEYGFNLIPGW